MLRKTAQSMNRRATSAVHGATSRHNWTRRELEWEIAQLSDGRVAPLWLIFADGFVRKMKAVESQSLSFTVLISEPPLQVAKKKDLFQSDSLKSAQFSFTKITVWVPFVSILADLRIRGFKMLAWILYFPTWETQIGSRKEEIAFYPQNRL